MSSLRGKRNLKHPRPAGHNQVTEPGCHSSPSAQSETTPGALCFYARGSYILIIELPEQGVISVGRLGPITFPRAFYAYVGSAMGGVGARINRHLNKRKGFHWHIDYLLDRAPIREVFVLESEGRTECTIARALAKVFDSIPHFGCSDCRCRSHLFFDEQENELRSKVIGTLNEMRLSIYRSGLRSDQEGCSSLEQHR